MAELDWQMMRRHARSDVRPPEWPANVQAISTSGLTLLGIDHQNRLYWDGEEIVVRRKLALATFERTLSAIIAAATVATAAAAWHSVL